MRSLLGAAIGGGVYCLSLTQIGTSLEEWTRDLRLRARKAAPPSKAIRLVGVDDDDLRTFGNWPIGRGIHADVLRILGAMGAERVVVDVLFTGASADPAQDRALEEAIGAAPEVILPYYYEGGAPEEPLHFETGSRYGVSTADLGWLEGTNPAVPHFRNAKAYGAANVLPDPGDEIVRRVPLFIETGGQLHPSLSMQAVMRALAADSDQIRIFPGNRIEIVDTPKGTLSIPIDRDGFYRVNFHGGLDAFAPSISYTSLYAAVEDPKKAEALTPLVRGRTVIVGDVSTGSTDLVTTPVGRVPGVLVHASVIGNILERNHLRTYPSWIVFAGCLALGAILCGGMCGERRLRLLLPLIMLMAGLLIFVSFQCAEANLLLPLTPALLIAFLVGVAGIALHVLEARGSEGRIRAALAPFIDRNVFSEVIANDLHRRKAERKELTVLFADIRNFAAWTEKQEPDEVVRLLNEFFSLMIPIVRRHGGTVDKLMGDGIMVFVGAPQEHENHAEIAVRIALEMREKMKELCERLATEARDAFEIGIGIHSGFVTVGSFGTNEFRDYTIMGRTVNLAARIQGACPPGKILVTARTRALVGSDLATAPFGAVEFKGIGHPVELFDVEGFRLENRGVGS